MSLSIAVDVPATGLTKTVRLATTMSVHDAIKVVQEKVNFGGKDHTLVLLTPQRKNCEAVWLKREKTLEFYDLTGTDHLEYRKRHTPLKIVMADGSAKTIMLDASLPEIDLVGKICEKVGLSNADEYNLVAESAPEKWLDLDKPLSEQLNTTDQTFTLKRRFFFFDSETDAEGGEGAAAKAAAALDPEQNPIQVMIWFAQARDEIVAGDHPCSLEEAVKLAAMQMAATVGPYNEKYHGKAGYLTLASCLPPVYVKAKNAERAIQAAWAEIKKEPNQCKAEYIRLCRQLPTWGLMMFKTTEVEMVGDDKKKKEVRLPRFLAIAKGRIIRFEREEENAKRGTTTAPKLVKEYSFRQLRRWNASPGSITLDFAAEGIKQIFTEPGESEKIANSISGYIKLEQRKRQAEKRFQEIEDAKVAEIQAIEHAPVAQVSNTFSTVTTSGFEFGNYSEAAQMLSMIAGEVMQYTSEEHVASTGSQLADRKGQITFNSDRVRELLEELKRLGMHAGTQESKEKIRMLVTEVGKLLAATSGAGILLDSDADRELLLDSGKGVQLALSNLFAIADKLEQGDATLTKRDGADMLARAMATVEAALLKLEGVSHQNVAQEAQESLVHDLATAAHSAALALADEAEAAASQLKDASNQKRAAQAVRSVRESAQGVLDVSDVLSAVLLDQEPAALSLLARSIKVLSDNARELVESSSEGVDPATAKALKEARDRLNKALASLTEGAALPEIAGSNDAYEFNRAARAILDSLSVIMTPDAQKDPKTLMKQGLLIKKAGAQLGVASKGLAQYEDPESRERLSNKVTGVMVQARDLLQSLAATAKSPDDSSASSRLRDDALELADRLQNLLEDSGHHVALAALYTAAKYAASCTARLASNVYRGSGSLSDPSVQDPARINSHNAAVAVADLLQVLKDAKDPVSSDSADAKKQYRATDALIHGADVFAPVAFKLVGVGPKVSSACTDSVLGKDISSNTSQTAKALRALLAERKQMKAVAGQIEAAEALEVLATAVAGLDNAKLNAENSLLTPESVGVEMGDGDAERVQTVETQFKQLVSHLKKTGAASKALLETSVQSPDASGDAMKKTASAAARTINVGIMMAATISTDKTNQKALLNQVGVSASALKKLFRHAKTSALHPSDDALRALLAEAGAQVGEALAELGKTAQAGIEIARGSDKAKQAAEEAELARWRSIEERAASELKACADTVNLQGATVGQALKEVDSTADVAVNILSAVQAIVGTTGKLAQSGATVQREFLSLIGDTGHFYKRDTEYPEALIAAAQHVMKATKATVENAASAAEDESKRDGIADDAEDLGQAVQQLVKASSAEKSGLAGGSEATLHAAAQEVNAAIRALVAAIKGYGTAAEEVAVEPVEAAHYDLPEHMLSQMEQQEKILRLERELNRQRQRMVLMKQARA